MWDCEVGWMAGYNVKPVWLPTEHGHEDTSDDWFWQCDKKSAKLAKHTEH